MLFDPQSLRGRSAVVIDVLRASTTITHALAHGASAVIPTEHVEQAWAVAKEIPVEDRLLGGERESLTIEGFDLDNSPFSYTPERVTGKTVIFTTTNGTYALQKCSHAQRILIGSFTNLSAIVKTLIDSQLPVHLVCAGTNRQLTAEDILFAGAVADRLLTESDGQFELHSVESQMAVDFYRSHCIGTEAFQAAMFESLGGTNLRKLGLDADIKRAMEVDRFAIVPEWNPTLNRITVSRDE